MSAPLVLLPGLICDARVYAAQLGAFPEALAWNAYGPCDSLAEMARHVLQASPARMSLLGHSMGARVALEICRLAPQRVERLALVSTGSHPVRPGETEKRHALLALGQAKGMEALVDAWLPPMVAHNRQEDEALMATLRSMCIDAGVATFAAQIHALLTRPALDELLPRIGCPTLIAGGERDVWSPPAQHLELAAAIAESRLAIVPNAGHMLPVEQPDDLNQLIAQWLELPCA